MFKHQTFAILTIRPSSIGIIRFNYNSVVLSEQKKFSRVCNVKRIEKLVYERVRGLAINLRIPDRSNSNAKIWWLESGDI